MNRYDTASVAKFSPLSFQELSAAPLAMRQKHDSLDAQRELLRQGLAKTNPHEKYYEEAVRLKDELNNQITSQAELLAKEGVNPNSQADFLKLNRDYQETMSPTGKLGMINAHNVNLQSTYKNYIDEAIKANQSPAMAKLHADMAIKKHLQQPLYDERGRVVDFSAGNAAPEYMDNIKWINDLAANVGFDKTSWAQASSGLSKSNDGTRFVVNSSAKGLTKDNVERLNRLAERANSEVSNPTSRIRQNIDYNFQNPQTELNNMLNHLYSKREREDGVTDRSYSKDNLNWSDKGKDKFKDSELQGYNLSDGKTFATNTNLMKEAGLIGGGFDQFTPEERAKQSGINAPLFKVNPTAQSTSTTRSPEWKKLASSINRTLPSNQRFKEGSKEEESAVKKYLTKYGNTTIQNRVVDPYSHNTGLMFADETLKDVTKAQQNLWKRVKNGSSTLVDDEGKEYTKDEIAKISKFSYDGDLTADSNVSVFTKDKRKNYIPHFGTIVIGTGDDAKLKNVYVSRNSDDFEKPQYKGAVDKNKINNIVKSGPNRYHTFKVDGIKAFKNYGMKNVEMKYNEESKSYDLSFIDHKGQNRDLKFQDDENGTAEARLSEFLIEGN
jgi:uncharacterized protein YjhX (UPF0386 family)